MWQYQNTDELYHHGILGMKWGRRKQVIKNVNRINKVSRKLNKHGIGGENRYTPEFAKRRNAKMMTKGLQDGTLKKIPKGYKKVGDKILTDKQELKNAINKKYKEIQKKATFKDKILLNNAGRKAIAKYMVRDNMTMSEAKKKVNKEAVRNSLLLIGASALYGYISYKK